jgi:hypothetical protein
MVSISAVKDTLGILSSAAAILDSKAVKAGAKVAIFARDTNKVGGAITQFSAQTTIISRAFIEESLTEEIVIPNLMKTIHEWYAAQIIAALHISKMVDSKRTVQDVMSVLQDGRHNRSQDLLNNVLERAAGQEAFLSNYLGEAGLEALKYDSLNQPIRETSDKDSNLNGVSVKSVNTSDNRIGPMGELFEVTLTNPENTNASVKVPVFIQMQPSLIPHQIAPRFVDMQVQPSVWQRWTQMRAGELSFWKDFVFKVDVLNAKKNVVKDPNAASAMRNYLSTISKKDMYALGDASSKKSVTRSANLANSVVILSEETIAQAKADSNIDLHREADRQRYFRDTYTMLIAIVDTIHQRVTIYFNGIDGELDVSYNEFRPRDQKFDPNMFMQALSAFSTNSIGRLR